MSLDKAIEHGKEMRKPYRGSKSFDTTCRNHGGKTRKREHRECPYCKANRLYGAKHREPVVVELVWTDQAVVMAYPQTDQPPIAVHFEVTGP